MKKTELTKAAKEVKAELGFEDIDLKGALKAQLTEVATLIGSDSEDAIEEDELNDLSKETKAVLLELKGAGSEEVPEEKEKPAKKKKAKAKKEPEPEEEDELVAKIKEADLDELKALIKSEGKEVFPVASRGLPLQKNVDKLRDKALTDLGEAPGEEEKEESPKKEKKAKVKKGETPAPTYTIMTAVAKNPDVSIKELDELNESFETPLSPVSVRIFRNDMLKAMKILKEIGKL